MTIEFETHIRAAQQLYKEAVDRGLGKAPGVPEADRQTGPVCAGTSGNNSLVFLTPDAAISQNNLSTGGTTDWRRICAFTCCLSRLNHSGCC